MKILLTIILITIFMAEGHAQIGVNTENPLSVFHIDGLSNNKEEMSLSESRDDFSFQITNDNSISLGIGTIPDKNTSSQLDLGGQKSGLMLNRVPLKSNTDISRFLEEPLDGTIIYNTTENDNVSTGIHYYKEGIWYPLLSRNTISQIKYLNLSSSTQAYTSSNSYQNPTYSNYMYWIDPTVTNATASHLIKLPETSSYAFTVRLWGQRPSSTSDARLVIYIWLLKEGVKQVSSVLDVAELNVPVPAGTINYSYSVTLAANVTAGDNVSLSIGAPNNSGSTATMNPGSMLANTSTEINPSRTSVIFWKLQ